MGFVSHYFKERNVGSGFVGGRGDIGLRRPAVRAELNLVKDELEEESMAAEEGEYGNLVFGEGRKCEKGYMDGDSGEGGDGREVWVEMVVAVWQDKYKCKKRKIQDSLKN